MATYILTIEGVERPLLLPSLNYQAVINGRDVLNCTIVSAGGAYRPALGDDVLLSENGTDIFGGIIDRIEETGAGNQPINDIQSEITCVAYNIYADRRFITETFAAGTTIASIAGTIVTNYLSDYSITLDGGQVTGPSLTSELAFDGVVLSEALDQITTLTGFFWKVSPSKVFTMFTAGAVAAPFNVVDGDGNHVGDVRVVQSREKYYNRVILKYGDAKVITITDAFTGTGALSAFPLTYAIQGVFPNIADGAAGYGVVDFSAGPTTESLGGLSAPTGYIWEYDPALPDITRRLGAVGNGVAFSVRYDVQFPQTVTAENTTDISVNGLAEFVAWYPDIYDKTIAQGLADQLLAQSLNIKTEVEYDTYGLGLSPGMTQTITAADRAVNDSFLVTEVQTRSQFDTQDVLRHVKAIDGTSFRGSFREVYEAWLGRGETSTAGPTVSTGGGCGWNYWDTSIGHALINHADATVIVRGKDGGSNYGVEGLPASMLLSSKNDGIQQLVIGSESSTAAKALTFWYKADGSVYIEHDDPQGMHVLEYSGQLTLGGGGDVVIDPGDSGTADNVLMAGLNALQGLALGTNPVVTSFPLTIDSGLGSGGVASSVFYLNPSANATVNLPSLTAHNVLPQTGYYRVLILRNIGTHFITLDGNSTDTIDGSPTVLLAPGQKVILISLTGTGAGWYTAARSRPEFITTLTDTQIKALPTSSITLVPGPPTGWRIQADGDAWVEIDSTTADYTNIHADASLSVHTVDWQADLYSYIVNGNGTGLTRLTDLLTASTNAVARMLAYTSGSGGSGTAFTTDWGLVTPLIDAEQAESQALVVALDNQGSGNLTGGNAANTGRIRGFYVIEPVS